MNTFLSIIIGLKNVKAKLIWMYNVFRQDQTFTLLIDGVKSSCTNSNDEILQLEYHHWLEKCESKLNLNVPTLLDKTKISLNLFLIPPQHV